MFQSVYDDDDRLLSLFFILFLLNEWVCALNNIALLSVSVFFLKLFIDLFFFFFCVGTSAVKCLIECIV